MSDNYKPLKSGYTRVFIIAGRARPDHKPEYFASLKMGGLNQSYGDITKIEVPDPKQYGKYVEADRIRGATERATFSLAGRFAAAISSRLLELARGGCPVDVQLHIGECTNPSIFNSFTKAIVAEDSNITSHATDDLGALESGENALVNETAELSAKDYYEVLPLSFTSKAGDLIQAPINSVVVYDTASCGTCSVESDGCKRVFAVADAAGGSPSSGPEIIFSLNKGVDWYWHDIDTLTSAQNADAVAGIGENIVIVSNGALSLSYALVSELANLEDPVFIEITTGFVATKGPNHIFSLGDEAFIVGNGGYVYYTDDPAAGVVVLDAGISTVSNLLFVYAYDSENVVAVGNDGAIVFSTNGTSFDVAPSTPVGAGIHLTSVFMKSESEWWVTTSNGLVYYTLNSGTSWTVKAMPGTAPSKMTSVVFATDSVGYAAGIVSSKGKVFRTYDGGYSWTALPEGAGQTPTSTEATVVAVCVKDPNFIVVGGANSTDGVLIVGQS